MLHALLIIAKQGYQDVELDGTRKALQQAKFSITLGSTDAGECSGKFGGKEEASVALRDVAVSDYDMIAFIGGPGAFAFKDDADCLRVAREASEAGIVLGAICIAPTLFAAAGVLRGKKATVANKDGQQEGFLASHGAHYTGESVTVDGLIVTANGPDAAGEFGRKVAEIAQQ